MARSTRALETPLRAVEELLITATPGLLRRAAPPADRATSQMEVDTSAPNGGNDSERLTLADDLVTRAQQQSARIRFIEDPALLAEVDGVGAILRFRI